ncbi:MAG: TIGR00282 family metallophosphoesterase [Oscillospiraceae bacterium]|nr:YmdB family metallophosphoesterase [Oscillospiraceae bacterium]MCI7498261.1 YmdB family metallophosphoesterase [Oscillospiraceae bacterium]MDD7278216.1 TIGR00282 family metallophosphoesterase [Oscillospiraceae bacterium]
MNVLFIGDIVGSNGCDFAEKTVGRLRAQKKLDLVIANGENSADGNGITKASMEHIFRFADVITTGNHCFRRKEFTEYYDIKENLLRPANYPEGVVGKGVVTVDMGRYSFAVINLMGTAFMEALNNPYECIDRLLGDIDTKNILVDFHAEATSEKKAMGFYLSGKVSAVMGTHTHVQTADEAILDGHTAYITDAGMCGAELSVLGVKKELAIEKQRTKCPVRFTESDEAPFFNGVLMQIDEKCGKACGIERLIIR